MKIATKLSMLFVSSLMLLATFSPALALTSPIMAPGIAVLSSSNSSWTSTNWSGYAVTGATGSVTYVSGSWIVPNVGTSSSTTFAACWVGIDGFNSNTVEQTGTLSSTGSYTAYGIPSAYCAWYEFYPAGMVVISHSVSAGDLMYATVTYTASSSGSTGTYMQNSPFGSPLTSTPITSSSFPRDPLRSRSSGTFTVTIADYGPSTSYTPGTTTATWTYSKTATVSGAKESSAEWIVEAPSSGRTILPLATFTPGPALFGEDNTGYSATANCYATVSSKTGSIGSFSSAVQTITMINSKGTAIATPSSLSYPDGTSFSVAEP